MAEGWIVQRPRIAYSRLSVPFVYLEPKKGALMRLKVLDRLRTRPKARGERFHHMSRFLRGCGH